MRSEVQAVAWRAYWPVTLLAVTFLVVVGLFGTYLTGRQQAADTRANRQRQAICAILANIPGHIPREIATARRVFARPGHPGDCMPIPPAKGKAAATPRPTPAPRRTVIVVRPVPAPSPVVTTRPPRPTPRPTPTRPAPKPTPTPRPTPSRTCIGPVCLQPPLQTLGGLNGSRRAT